MHLTTPHYDQLVLDLLVTALEGGSNLLAVEASHILPPG